MYKYSEPNSFKVVLIDQVKGGMSKKTWDEIKDKVHLYIHPPRAQLGYAKAMNEGIIHGLHWGSDIICPSNDDLEVIDSRWIDGIHKTFELDKRIMGVCPMSPRVAGWGYGVGYNPEVLPYKEEYTKEDYDYLLKGDFTECKEKLPTTYPRKVTNNIIDGAVFVMPYFKKELFEEIGLLDEHFYPGSGEDMDLMARAYRENYRIVSSAYSWIWHWWSSSKELFASGQLEDQYYKWKPYWNNMSELWPEGHDAWGYKEVDGRKVLLPRVPEIFVEEIK
jgi:GT2 family glycosyltransferase